jgi:hypothetical protein
LLHTQDQPLRRIAVILGEFGVTGHSGSSHSRTPQGEEVSEADVTFLQDLAQYLQSLQEKGAAISWFWWAWNANSGEELPPSLQVFLDDEGAWMQDDKHLNLRHHCHMCLAKV